MQLNLGRSTTTSTKTTTATKLTITLVILFTVLAQTHPDNNKNNDNLVLGANIQNDQDKLLVK